MGCDIHMWAEVQKIWGNPDTPMEWRTVGHVFPYDYYREDETPTFSTYNNGDGTLGSYENNQRWTEQPYNGRNYDLFAILANVRNGNGFAGVDTGDGFKPIDMPRGIPEDASDYYKNEASEMGTDGHSHSWFTLDELLAFDWANQSTTHRGWVEPEQYKEWKEKGKPKSWCGSADGGRVKHVSNDQLDTLIATGATNAWSYYTQVSWQESYADSCGVFLTQTIPALQKLSENKDANALRIVFFFDN